MTDLGTRMAASPAAPTPDAQAQLAGDANSLIETVIAALRTVHDPEIPVNIYDLGLIYRIAPDHQGAVEIDMTLTAPGCPVAGEMVNWVRTAVSDVDGIESVKVNLVFDPPWDKSKMSEDVQLELGLL
jgi:Predicted metal-sulfur cluster biosynthetic enzyme